MPEENNVIETSNLSKRFDGILAVSELNLTVERGEIFGFIGPNGAGKTTTIRLLNCLLKPTSGSAKVMGYDILEDPTEIRRRTGVLTESAALYERLSAIENLRIFGELYGIRGKELERRIDEMLELFGLSNRKNDKVGAFSSGMKQRLSLARTMIHDPDILFLDEPTAKLDPEAARLVRDYIEELSKEERRTVFICTHNLQEAQRLCSRIAVISEGRIIASGSPKELEKRLWEGTQVDISLAEISDSLVKMIEDLDYTDGLKVEDDNKLSIKLETSDRIPDLVKTIVDAGGRIFSVIEAAHSLEEIYFKLRGDNK